MAIIFLLLIVVLFCAFYGSDSGFRGAVDSLVGKIKIKCRRKTIERISRRCHNCRFYGVCDEIFCPYLNREYEYDDEDDEEGEDDDEEGEVMEKREQLKSKIISYYCQRDDTLKVTEEKGSTKPGGYSAVLLALNKVTGATDECIQLYRTGQKFDDLSETMAADALMLILENVEPALNQVNDHFARAPYSAKNADTLIRYLAQVAQKVVQLKDIIDRVVRNSVYRPLDEDSLKTTFDAGFANLREENEAAIRSAEESIRMAQEAIEEAEAAIREFKQFGEILRTDETPAETHGGEHHDDYDNSF